MDSQNLQNLDIQAIKDIARLAWLLNFEAPATAGNGDDALRTDAALNDRASPY